MTMTIAFDRHYPHDIAPSVDTWHVPPEHQGQIIVIAYGVDDDGEPWRRTTDRSIGQHAHTYEALDWADISGPWEPWNQDPTT